MKMTRWVPVCALVGVSAFGCSSTGAAGSGSVSSGSNGGSGSGSGATSSSVGSGDGFGGNSSGSGSSVDGGVAGGVSVDASPMADPDIAYSVTLTMDTFTVNPGTEVYYCQDFANPFDGMQADIKTYELHMAQGSHHLLAFYTSNATSKSIVPCSGLISRPFTFAAQSANSVLTYPQGVGATIPTTIGFTLNVHYINPGNTPITGHVALTMHVAKPGLITQHAGVLFLSQFLTVPPTGQPFTSTRTYTLPQDIYLMASASHMHQRATNFTATTSTGQTLFQTNQWAEPAPKAYSPPLLLTAGTNIDWSCTYVNDTGQPLTYGESAVTNVMCISVSSFYPVQDPSNPVIATLL